MQQLIHRNRLTARGLTDTGIACRAYKDVAGRIKCNSTCDGAIRRHLHQFLRIDPVAVANLSSHQRYDGTRLAIDLDTVAAGEIYPIVLAEPGMYRDIE